MPDSRGSPPPGAPREAASTAARFRRPWHRLVAQVLGSLNRALLTSAMCYFGGGTLIVMELDEFRESVDIDFLCSDRTGYRLLRNAVTTRSLGDILAGDYELIRDVRADMYGIRTFLRIDEQPVKIEIISEGRLSLIRGRYPSVSGGRARPHVLHRRETAGSRRPGPGRLDQRPRSRGPRLQWRHAGRRDAGTPH